MLKAGIDQEDQQYLFGSIDDGLEAAFGAMITARNELLLRAALTRPST